MLRRIICALMFCGAATAGLLPGDSGYEAGYGYFRTSWNGTAALVFDAADAAEGGQSVCFTLPPGDGATFHGPELRLEKEADYVLSFYARASRPGVRAQVTLVNTGWMHTEGFEVELGEEWRRCEVPFRTREEVYWLLFGAANDGADDLVIHFDACQLDAGKEAREFAAEPGLYTGMAVESATSAVYFPGEEIAFRVMALDARGATPQDLALTVTVNDYLGRAVSEQRFPAAWRERAWRERVVPEGISGLGHFTVRAVWTGAGDEAVAEAVRTFAVILPPLPNDLDIAPFSGVNGGLPPGGERIGVRWLESCVTWNNLEPRPGEYDFGVVAGLRRRKEAGFFNKLSLIHQPSTPDWARDPEEAAEAARMGLNPGKNLLPTEEACRNFGEMLQKLGEYAGDAVDLYELGGEDDLIAGNEAYYRTKYPDAVHDGYVCGPVSTRLGVMTRHGIAGLRAGAPGVPVAVNRVSGEDCYQRDFQFTRGVLAELNGDFDYFSMDAYCRRLRYIDAENTWIGLPDWDFAEVFGNAGRLTSELAKGQPAFISEYGFAIDNTLAFDHPKWLEMAKRAPRALMLARALNSPCFFWFSSQQLVEAGKYDYGMWRYGDPTMVVPAFAAAVRAVENVRAARLDERFPNVKMVLFEQKDRAVFAMWSVVGDAAVGLDLPEGAVYTDLMGNPLAIPEDGLYVLDTLPRYVTLAGTDAGTRLGAMLDRAADHSFPLGVGLMMKSRGECGIGVSNPTGYRGMTVCEYAFDGGARQWFEHDFEPETGWFVPLTLPPGARRLDWLVRTADGRERRGMFPAAVAPWPAGTIEPGRAPLFVLEKRSDIAPPDPHIRWEGPADLSVLFYGGYDAENLYLAAEVRDDRHCNNRDGSSIWNGDCLQVAFDAEVRSGGSDGYDAADTEIVFALTEAGPQAHVAHGTPGELDYTIVRDEAAGVTRYAVTLPRKALGLEGRGRIFGFNFVVFDDDDGGGQSYYCRLADGITGAKNPNAFPRFILE